METYIVRVWLPDRPGALGQVASRIGAVRAEIVGIDILERGGGRAIDELAVQLPEAGLLDLLVDEIRAVDGVDVEEVRPVDGLTHDPRADALETAAIIVGAADRSDLLDAVVSHGRRVLGGAWAAVVHLSDDTVHAVDGDAPSTAWLVAFVEGSRSAGSAADPGDRGPDDVVWAPMPATGLAVVVGRVGSGFRARERRQVAALARVADTRLVDFVRRAHPSARS
ncbi:hypothetical protein [Actinospongicola halichondriae]|uniref:hypothetical protein n=1 Tax=Actinospongicola halichondriae TaxID=3236844 RepID=UPI003D560D8F